MKLVEGGVRLSDIKDPSVLGLLESSRRVHKWIGMDPDRAIWHPRKQSSTLIWPIDITPLMQGWAEINHGGLADLLLHDVTGFAALIQVRKQCKQKVLGVSFEAKYHYTLPIYTAVQVIATVRTPIVGDYVSCSGKIRFLDQDGDNEYVYADGQLRVKTVDVIRKPNTIPLIQSVF